MDTFFQALFSQKLNARGPPTKMLLDYVGSPTEMI